MRSFDGMKGYIESISGDDIRREIEDCERAIKYLNRILAERRGDGNEFQYGFRIPFPLPYAGSYRVADSFADAVDKATKELNDPDAGYKVHKVYH